MSVLPNVITVVTGCFDDIVAWLPITAAAGFAIVGHATGGVSRIIGIKRRGGRRR